MSTPINSANRPTRARAVRTSVAQVVRNRKIIAQVGGPKAVLAALQVIADAFVS